MPNPRTEKPRTEKPRPTPTKASPAPPSQTELQKQRADWEGMAPHEPDPLSTLKNEGEGNRTADRSYREGVKKFIEDGRSEEAAEEAEHAINSKEGEELRRAEQRGKAKQSS